MIFEPTRVGKSEFSHTGPVSGKAASAEEVPTMATGIVKSFDLKEGFGFISPDDGSPDVKVKLKAAEKSGLFTLLEGERIDFELDRKSVPGEVMAAKLRSPEDVR